MYAVFLAASPVIATLIGVAVLGDRLSLVQWGGLTVITVGSAAVANMSFALKGRGHVPAHRAGDCHAADEARARRQRAP